MTDLPIWERGGAAVLPDTPWREPVRKALAMLKPHHAPFMQLWTSTYANTHLERFNGHF